MRKFLIIVAMLGSAGLLIGAFGFQFIGEMAPCKMCLWQRWPHAAAVVIGALALAVRGAVLPLLGALSTLSCAGIGIYHTGVERGWWEGPTSCTAGSVSGLTPEQLLEQIMAAPITRCDEVPWEMLGLSMASWNALASFGLALIWIAASRYRR